MSLVKDASAEQHIEHALQVVAAQAAQMRKHLESPQGKLLTAIKQVTIMLEELMTSQLPPRLYYELYNSCFDALSQLQEYLVEDHKNHHLADVYEIVEYTSNVLPRLYLMITVGTAFLTTGDAPTAEVLKDMLEMTRGIQNPLRGLFLRYYLGQRTGEFLIGNKVATDLSIQFTLTNFIEMNKLWVRYQHQGHTSDYGRRLNERVQLQTIVGSSILRLSQLDSIDVPTFSSQILPALLDQVVQCRDKLAQEYLLDIIVQVFPAEFHLETLELFMECIDFLVPETSRGTVLSASLGRIIGFAKARKDELRLSASLEATNIEDEKTSTTLNVEASDARSTHENFKASAEGKENEEAKTPEHSRANSVTNKTEASEPELSDGDAKEASQEADPLSINKITSEKEPSELEAAAQEPRAADQKDAEAAESSSEAAKKNNEGDSKTEPKEDSKKDDDRVSVLAATFNEAIKGYWAKIKTLSLEVDERSRLIRNLIELMSITSTPVPLLEFFQFIVGNDMKRSDEVELLLLSLFNADTNLSDIMTLLREFPTLLSSQSKETRHAVSERVVDYFLASSDKVSDEVQTRQVLELFTILLRSGGFDTSKVSQFVRLIHAETTSMTLKLLQIAHKTMREGGRPVVKQTSSLIVHACLVLLREKPTATDVAQIMKFSNQVCHDLATVGGEPFTSFRLYLACGQAADYTGAEEACYEMFAQAFTTYEEMILESHQQIIALHIAIQKLQQISVFSRDNFEPLAQRSVQYAQRLLKRPDQCRALLSAAHLFWDNDYSDARQVETILGRALRSADSVMDSATSVELFLDVLDTHLYFLANDVATITANAVNSLFKLVKENIKTSKDDGVSITTLEARLSRTEAFVRTQIKMFPRFEDIEV